MNYFKCIQTDKNGLLELNKIYEGHYLPGKNIVYLEIKQMVTSKWFIDVTKKIERNKKINRIYEF
jgi:hypothetical protein